MSGTFLIGDNHFTDYDGPDGVRLFFKPRAERYPSVWHMNHDMLTRWNRVVSNSDVVYSLGDFSHCLTDFKKYQQKLRGNKIFILGNHDFELDYRRRIYPYSKIDFSRYQIISMLTRGGRNFMLVHNPSDVPKWWHGWVIHGHHHWMLPNFPFIDGKTKNINVACELVNYTPVDIDWILSLDIDTIDHMDTAASDIVRI